MGDTKLLLKLMLERDDQVFVDNNQLESLRELRRWDHNLTSRIVGPVDFPS